MTEKAGRGSPLRQRVVGYVRVSTEGQGKSGIGLESQKAAIQAFTDKMDWDLIQIFEDLATAMGPSSAKDRVGLQRALSAAKENDAVVLAYDWSRISRDTASFHDISALFPDKDRIFSVSQENTLEAAAASGQYAYAQKQGEAISRSTKEGMAKKRELGAVFGNHAIRDVQRLGSAAVSDKANVLVRQIADVLIEIGDVSLTRNQVAEMLNSRGILTGQGKPWDKSRIRLPLEKARALIANDEQKTIDDSYASNPKFGLF